MNLGKGRRQAIYIALTTKCKMFGILLFQLDRREQEKEHVGVHVELVQRTGDLITLNWYDLGLVWDFVLWGWGGRV